MKLSKFYNILSRNTFVALTASGIEDCFFTGYVKDIPKKFDDCNVISFVELSDEEIEFTFDQVPELF